MKAEVSRPSGRFVGFGGEFIRHPFTQFCGSLAETIEKGFYSEPMDRVCKLVNMRSKDYRESLYAYASGLPERSPDDLLRRFYYEYYSHYVGAGGEERERMHFWSVAPLWSRES